ncbi:FKBP-type peptidyl-prolyl cis-trans isomerase [Methylolobus aquaticus]
MNSSRPTLFGILLALAAVPIIATAQAVDPALAPADPAAAPIEVIPDADRMAGAPTDPATAAASTAAPTAANPNPMQRLPSGVRYRVLKLGKGPLPDADDIALVSYVAKIQHGPIFDQSGPNPKAVRVSTLIPGWAEVMKLVPVGTRCQIWIPANQAFKGNTPLRGKPVAITMKLIKLNP